jgi:antitoxin (DNA-binding transcriptional repressor) of toxin-antitoxin stability system
MQVTIHAAEADLSELIEAVLAGEEVVIAEGDKPLVKLVAIKRARFKFGILAGHLSRSPPDFFEPMDDGELSAWEGA